MLTTGWGVVVVIALTAFFVILGPSVIEIMTSAEDVRIAANQYLIWLLVLPILGLWSWMLDGIFIGATQTRDMRNMMAISFVIYWGAVWILVPMIGNHGLWLALLISYVARGVTLGLCYPRIEARARSEPV